MKQIESEHHKAVIKYLRILKAQNKIITFFAPINEIRVKSSNPIKNKAIALKEFHLGKHSGVSDLTIIFKHKVLFLEMKQPMKKLKNGNMTNSHSKQSESQIEFEKEINQSEVCFYEVGYGFVDAKNIIDEYLKEIRS